MAACGWSQDLQWLFATPSSLTQRWASPVNESTAGTWIYQVCLDFDGGNGNWDKITGSIIAVDVIVEGASSLLLETPQFLTLQGRFGHNMAMRPDPGSPSPGEERALAARLLLPATVEPSEVPSEVEVTLIAAGTSKALSAPLLFTTRHVQGITRHWLDLTHYKPVKVPGEPFVLRVTALLGEKNFTRTTLTSLGTVPLQAELVAVGSGATRLQQISVAYYDSVGVLVRLINHGITTLSLALEVSVTGVAMPPMSLASMEGMYHLDLIAGANVTIFIPGTLDNT